MISHLKLFYKNNPWKGRLLLALALIIILLTVIRIALSPGIIYGANSWLKSQGINSTIEDINIDIFDGTVSLINAEGLQDDIPLFEVGLVEIHWQWQPLSDKTIEVTSVVLDKFTINIKHYSDSIIIGGVEVPLIETAAEITEPEIENTEKKTPVVGGKPW